MHSPLPSLSALEAGLILDDPRPSRLSRVQDNVRNLLRASLQDLNPTPYQATVEDEVRSPLQSPLRVHIPQTSPQDRTSRIPAGLFPPISHTPISHTPISPPPLALGHLASHPDLSDPSLALYLQERSASRQRKAWKRERSLRSTDLGDSSISNIWRGRKLQVLVCILAGLLLAGTVATYLALATTVRKFSPTFHILFVLGILFATIVLAHSIARACIFGKDNTSPLPPPRLFVITADGELGHRHRGRYRRRRRHRRSVDLAEHEVRSDSREAMPSAATQSWVGVVAEEDGSKDVEGGCLPQPPPPAYGRWRGSVRVDAEMMVLEEGLPSPRYEEVEGAAAVGAAEAARAPEMVEVRSSP